MSTSFIMPKQLNKQSTKKDPNGNNGHRKEKSRNSRGTVRPEVQVSGGKARERRTDRDQSNRSDPRSPRHGAKHEQQAQRSPDKLGDRHHSQSGRNSGLVGHTLRPKISERQAQLMLERLTRDHLLNNPNAIMRLDDQIRAFGKYTITKNQRSYQVYRSATLAAEPSSNRVAISWCVADKYGKDRLAQQLLMLDHEVERRQTEIAHYRHTLATSDDLMRKSVVSDRLFESQARLKYAQEHLEECLNLAKYWQQKGFNDETARIGIKNQNTTKPEGI